MEVPASFCYLGQGDLFNCVGSVQKLEINCSEDDEICNFKKLCIPLQKGSPSILREEIWPLDQSM